MASEQSRSRRWATGAAWWAVLFAAPNAYWAFGGTVGGRTIAANPDEIPLMNNSGFVMFSALAKVAVGLLVLAVGRGWGGPGVTRWLRVPVLVGGAGMLLYGSALLVQHGLMVAGVVSTPALLGTYASRWHFGLWDPIWILGGVLFLGTAWTAPRRSFDGGLPNVR